MVGMVATSEHVNKSSQKTDYMCEQNLVKNLRWILVNCYPSHTKSLSSHHKAMREHAMSVHSEIQDVTKNKFLD